MKPSGKKFLHIAVPLDLHKALRIRAARAGLSMTELIKFILGEYLKKTK